MEAEETSDEFEPVAACVGEVTAPTEVLGSNAGRGSFGVSFMAIDRAPIDLPPFARS